MFCTKCGSEIEGGSRFCVKCGHPTDAEGANLQDAEHASVKAEEERMRLEELTQRHERALELERERVRAQQAVEMTEPLVTPVAQVLDDGRMSYLAPELIGDDAAADPDDDVKRAKAAYKDAKKAAGKSSAPKVIAVIVAVLVVVAATAGAFWYMSQQSQAAVQEAQDRAAAAQAEADAAKQRADDAEAAAAEAEKIAASPSSAAATSKSAESSSAASNAALSSSAASEAASSNAAGAGGNASYVGTWEGDLLEATKYVLQARCYGAEGHPLVIDVKDVSSTGRVKANVKVLYHDHSTMRGSDVASTEGDEYVELNDMVATIDSSGSFRFEHEFSDRGPNKSVSLQVKTVDKADGTRTLEVKATSKSDDGTATDSYVLVRK